MDNAVKHELKNNLRVRQLASVGVNHPLFMRLLKAKQLKDEYMKYSSDCTSPQDMKNYYRLFQEDKEK